MHSYTHFSVGATENTYQSLPKYGSEKNTLHLGEEGPDEVEEPVPPALPPKHPAILRSPTPPVDYKKNKASGGRKRRLKRKKQERLTFDGEIYPPSLLQQEVPPAPPGMYGPRIFGEIPMKSNGGRKNPSVSQHPYYQSHASMHSYHVSPSTDDKNVGVHNAKVLNLVSISAPASVAMSNHRSYFERNDKNSSSGFHPNYLGPYIVPAQVAVSLNGGHIDVPNDTRKHNDQLNLISTDTGQLKTEKQNFDDLPSTGFRLICGCIFILVLILLLGAVVTAIYFATE